MALLQIEFLEVWILRVSLPLIVMKQAMHPRKTCAPFPFRVSSVVEALEILSGLMQEDDENVEVWYLTGVAFNRLRPPDYESARYILCFEL